jgi:hypothetical protein
VLATHCYPLLPKIGNQAIDIARNHLSQRIALLIWSEGQKPKAAEHDHAADRDGE